MNLTYDWKAGKLQNGWYFCKFENDEIFPALNIDDDFDDFQLKVVEVLARCDYEELERLKAAKSNNRYFLESLKNMTSALDYMIDENEKLQVKYKEDTDNLMCQIVNAREWEKLAKSHYPYRCHTIVGGVSFITIKEENKKLRSLLKSCKEEIQYLLDMPRRDVDLTRDLQGLYEMLFRINAAIGESEQ